MWSELLECTNLGHPWRKTSNENLIQQSISPLKVSTDFSMFLQNPKSFLNFSLSIQTTISFQDNLKHPLLLVKVVSIYKPPHFLLPHTGFDWCIRNLFLLLVFSFCKLQHWLLLFAKFEKRDRIFFYFSTDFQFLFKICISSESYPEQILYQLTKKNFCKNKKKFFWDYISVIYSK